MNWSGCDVVERVPGKLSGEPAIVGTRIFADTILEYYREGSSIEEIQEDYPSLSAETVQRMFDFVKAQHVSAA